ncbi:hypothetical protein PTKIN_Ptkin05aG0103300 [Pterospermum kingtungense]
MLRELSKSNTRPWAYIGDFNEILWDFEKRGGNLRPQWQIRDFCETLDECGLNDLGYVGPWFTWKRGDNMQTMLRERLDRVVATQDWGHMFSNYVVSYLTCSRSDHKPILLDTKRYNATQEWPKGTRRNFFDARWVKEDVFIKKVQDTWNNNKNLDVMGRLEVVRRSLSSWGRKIIPNFKEVVDKLHDELRELESKDPSDEVLK